jgi:hypothetical protein
VCDHDFYDFEFKEQHDRIKELYDYFETRLNEAVALLEKQIEILKENDKEIPEILKTLKGE